MNKLLIYIDEYQKFDLAASMSAISSIVGVCNTKTRELIGAVFECQYQRRGMSTIVRISPELETITIEGLGAIALEFSIELQSRIQIPLHATDMDYSFNVALRSFSSVSDLRRAIAA